MEDHSNRFVKWTNEHFMSNHEIFHWFKPEKLKGEGNIARKYKKRTKQHLAKSILADFMNIVIDDMIENNTTLILPSGYTNLLRIESMNDEMVKVKRQAGNYQDVDIYKSDYKIYHFVVSTSLNSRKSNKFLMYIPKEKYKKLIDKVNNGKRYFEGSFKRVLRDTGRTLSEKDSNL